MSKLSLRWVVALFLLASPALSGCGQRTLPPTPVRGTVSYRGVPLRGGVIVFTPDSSRGTHGPLAHAEIQADGTYVLQSGETPGAVPGWHRVTVSAVQSQPALPGQRFALSQSVLPERYRDPELAELSREVKANQANVIDFDLN